MSELHDKQVVFARLVPELIRKAFEFGYEVVFGEVLRDPRTAALNSKLGKGISNSLHLLSLAVDLKLFKNGIYLTDSEDYKTVGEYWKSLSTPGFVCCWGGDFKNKNGDPRPDGNHFSIAYLGTK